MQGPEAAFAYSQPALLRTTSLRASHARGRKRPRLHARVAPRASLGYTPSPDDVPESTSDMPTELTLAQQLLMKQYEEQVERMTVEDCRKMSVEIARQMMVKDNILRKMFRKDVNFGIEPPDPDSFKEPDEEQAT